MKHNLKIFALILAYISISSTIFAESKSSIIVRTGSFTMATKTQTIGSTVSFDTKSTSVYSVEYEHMMQNNLAWGGEVIGYSNTYYSGAGTSDSFHLMFNLRKYFDVSKHIQPFFGGGLGASTVTLGGVGTGNGGGFGYQVMAGVKFPFKTVSVVAEYKMISAKPDDKVGSSVDISGTGLFAGVSFNF